MSRQQQQQQARIEIDVRPAKEVGEWQELTFRTFSYQLPSDLAQSPLTPRAAGNLEKAIYWAIQGRRDEVIRAFRNAISGTSDVASLVKIAAAAHGEGFCDEAMAVFQKAARLAQQRKREPRILDQVRTVGQAMGYSVEP